MHYIHTDESDDIKHGKLTESPVRGSSSRFIANPIVDDIEADPPKGRARRQRVNGRIIIDTTVPDGDGYRYESPSCIVTGDPSVNDLTTDKWQHRELLDRKTEALIIRRIQNGDQRAFRQLLEAFHFRNVAKPIRHFIPGRTYRPSKKQKPTTVQLYEDLTSVGCVELWQSALRFDGRGRFSTLARRRILGEVSNEANYLRQNGFTSGDTVGRYLKKEVGRRTQTRLDRWIFSNLGAPPEELLEAQSKLVRRPVYHSLEEAADAIKRANSLQHADIYSDSGDDDPIERDSYDTSKTNRATEALEEFRDVYQSQDPLYWSPQLAAHRNRVSPIIDFWIREFCDPPRIKAKPQPKPVYKPCTVKPTGRILHPIDKPYWMEPREKPPDIFERKPPHDPDGREVATVRLKNGKTKRQYRQMRAKPDSSADVAWRKEYRAQDWYSWMSSEQEKRKQNVRTEPNQANGCASANVIVLESRRSRPQRFHVCQQCNPPSIGERFACEGTAG